MRYLMSVLIAVALAVSSGECLAQCGGCSEGSEGSEISDMADGEAEPIEGHETEEGPDGAGSAESDAVENVGVMEPGRSYDENTGMPDVVQSDEGSDYQ